MGNYSTILLLLLSCALLMRLAASMSSFTRFRTWPITAVRSLEPELRQMGLRIPAASIDGTSSRDESDVTLGPSPDAASFIDGTSKNMDRPSHLSDALVSVGAAGRGGTGSFISSQGLILTNWHVAYDAVRQASLLSENDYVKNGFVSKNRREEIQTKNYEVWITKSCVDVSGEVLMVIESEENKDPLKRANRVRDVMQEIAQNAQKKSGHRCDVQEMLPNESYVLFTYERIKDVRIVYVPPKSLGNFGGDSDNFEWPRHTADFTLLRAYVSPEGDAAEYSPKNVPYQPKAFLKTQKNGAQEGDFVFLLGFPGSTMRYAPSSRLLYSNDVAVPNMVKDFSRKLQLISEYESDSAEAALKLGSSKKGLANELKRSRGKLVMMQKLKLIQERKTDEVELCAKASGAEEALKKLSQIYDDFRQMDAMSLALEACRGIYAGSALLAAGHAMHEYLAKEKNKPDNEREAAYRERNLPILSKRLAKRIGDIHVPHEAALIRDAIQKLSSKSSPELNTLHEQMTEICGGSGNDLESMIISSPLKDLDDGEKLQTLLVEGNDETQSTILKDPFVRCASILWDTFEKERDRSKALLSERDALFAELLHLQRLSSGEGTMYPDCNGSLRLSAGHVEGYQAADAVECKPQTTLAGLLDKVTEARLSGAHESENGEFSCPENLYQMLSSGDDVESIQKVPVCLLYSTDTVGGNSGSPVMNAKGELVGINFDRQRQGLMNEFKWSRDYSRSIGVDVRYMLWLIGEYDGASNLVDEMLASA